MIEILVGNIASGKSTYAAKRAKEGALIINDDSIVTSVHGDYKLYSKKAKCVYKNVEMAIFNSAAHLGLDIIIDKTNMTRATRLRWETLGKAYEIPVKLVVFKMEDPEVHAARRFKSDARGYSYEEWLKVAERMNAQYEPHDEVELKYASVDYI